jgi:iron complex transport system permease protein
MRQINVTIILLIALAFSFIVGLGVGTASIPPQTIVAILLNATGIFHFPQTWPDMMSDIILQLRLPHVLACMLVGTALALSGTLFQGLLRNPLADPYLLGTSSGAALGVAIAYLLPFGLVLGLYSVGICAFIGALIAVGLVYGIATANRHMSVTSLILAGVAVSAFLGAIQTVLLTQSMVLMQRLGSIFSWLSGGIMLVDLTQIGAITTLVVGGLFVALVLSPTLDALALGDEGASYLGINIEYARFAIIGIASLLVASAVALSGIVSFVGLFVPHACRMLVGPRHRTLLLVVALAGSIFVIWADVLARVFMSVAFGIPTELPLGVITAIVGGPFFLWLLRRQNQVA